MATPLPSAYFSQGIELSISAGGATPTYTFIEGCQGFTGPGKTRDTVESTSHSSEGSYREYVAGLRDGGELSFDLNWLFGDPGQDLLEDSYDANTTYLFQMDFPMATTGNRLTFDGFVTDLTWNGPIDALVTRSVTIKVTGPVAVADAT